MPKDENINVRLDPQLKARVDELAARFGTTSSMIIRMLLEKFLQHADKNGGKVVMPPEFKSYDIREKSK